MQRAREEEEEEEEEEGTREWMDSTRQQSSKGRLKDARRCDRRCTVECKPTGARAELGGGEGRVEVEQVRHKKMKLGAGKAKREERSGARKKKKKKKQKGVTRRGRLRPRGRRLTLR